MPRFKLLTVEEARTLSRSQLLPRIEEEQKYWYRRMNGGEIRVGDDEAFKTFNQIMHIVIAPGRPFPGAQGSLDGDALDRDYWTRPLGELGDL
jgi:hypothetical protein